MDSHYCEFYFRENWGIIMCAGTFFIAHTGFAYYLYRRYRELTAKYRLLTVEHDSLRKVQHSLLIRIANIEKNVKPENTSTAEIKPPPYSDSNDNPPQGIQIFTNSSNFQSQNPSSSNQRNSIPYISSSESMYTDAVEELYTPNNTLLNSSAISASELLATTDDTKAPTTSDDSQFQEIDSLHDDGDNKKCYDECKKIYDSNPANQRNVELLWRCCRACYNVSTSLSDVKEKKAYLLEGQEHAQAGYALDANNFNVVKYAAIVTGALSEHLPMKEKIKQGHEFKGYLDKGLSMRPFEQTLLHMRGRFAYTVANLSWIERKAASAFFASPPKATFDDAITDFLAVEKMVPGTWIENLLYLAKSYIAKGDKKNALIYLNQVVTIKPTDEDDKEAIAEARRLITKASK